nr:hypothetical protein [Synechococcus sp. UW106]
MTRDARIALFLVDELVAALRVNASDRLRKLHSNAVAEPGWFAADEFPNC